MVYQYNGREIKEKRTVQACNVVVRKTQKRRGSREKVEEKMGMTVSKHMFGDLAQIVRQESFRGSAISTNIHVCEKLIIIET